MSSNQKFFILTLTILSLLYLRRNFDDVQGSQYYRDLARGVDEFEKDSPFDDDEEDESYRPTVKQMLRTPEAADDDIDYIDLEKKHGDILDGEKAMGRDAVISGGMIKKMNKTTGDLFPLETVFWEKSKEANANILLYNRFPKCGSTTFVTLFGKLAEKKGFQMAKLGAGPRHKETKEERVGFLMFSIYYDPLAILRRLVLLEAVTR